MTLLELEKELYSVANKIIGNIGPSTNGYNSITGEPYIEYAMKTDDNDEILDVWTQWINAYALFQQLAYPDFSPKLKIERKPKLYIYWQVKPEIKEHKGMIYVYARLLISRYDGNRWSIIRVINNNS